MLSEWLMLTALTWLVGSVAVPIIIMSSAAAEPLRDATRRARRRHVVIGALLLIFASFLALVFPRTRFTDGRLELALVMRLCLVVVSAIAMLRDRRYMGVVFVAGFALLLIQSLLSRGAMQGEWLALLLNDWLHLVLSSVWLGGLGLIAFVLMPEVLRQPTLQSGLSATLDRFSPIAMFCALGLGLTGLMQATQFVPDLSTIVSTPYGNLVGIKVILLTALIGFGALHQLVLMPRLRPRLTTGAMPLSNSRFAVTIAAELLIGLSVLVTAAALKAITI